MRRLLISMLVFTAFVLVGCGGGGSTSTPAPSGGSTGNGVTPSLSITDTSVVEGNATLLFAVSPPAASGTMTFTVTLSSASTSDITIDYATSDNTALAVSDYTATSGTLTIAAGATSGTIDVAITGESTYEADETLTMTLSAPTGATLATATAIGTITNDDAKPTVSVSMPATITEGNSGFKYISPAITLSAASGFDTTITYSFTSNHGGSGSGTVTIAKGQLSPNPMFSIHKFIAYEKLAEKCNLICF